MTKMTDSFPPPLIILASPRSFTSLVCAMLGQHPQAYGLPEVNIFAEPTMDALLQKATAQRQFLIHGVLRTVAELYAGEQTLETISMARRWVNRRREMTAGEIYKEWCAKAAPRRLIDKSPTYSRKTEILERIEAAFPNAQYLYLIRNPIDQGNSMVQAPQGFMQLLVTRSLDFSVDPPRIEPQHEWYKTQVRILEFLENIPDERRFYLRGESLLQEPEARLQEICQWMGLDWSEDACNRMLHPEDSPYAQMGPIGAQWGNNPGFQRSPHFRRAKKAPGTLDRPLPWWENDRRLMPDIAEFARSLGYT